MFPVQWPGFNKPKIMKVNTRSNALETTIREATILEELHGRAGAPNLSAVIPEYGVIVIEDLGRISLLSLLQSNDRSLNDNTWRDILYGVAFKLQQLHIAGYVHSELKPNHVMIRFDEDGDLHVQLIDFSLSVGKGARSRIHVR